MTTLAVLNQEVLDAIREVWANSGSLWIRVQNPLGQREVHILQGSLVGGSSTFRDDLLGVLLAQEGRFDLDLFEPMAQAAKAQGIRAGELMVREKLLTQDELDEALLGQAATRLLRMLIMPGLVTTGPDVAASVPGQPLAPLLAKLFVESIKPELLEPLVARMAGRSLSLSSLASVFEVSQALVRLVPPGLAGKGIARLDPASLEPASLRLCCAMLALGVVEAR